MSSTKLANSLTNCLPQRQETQNESPILSGCTVPTLRDIPGFDPSKIVPPFSNMLEELEQDPSITINKPTITTPHYPGASTALPGRILDTIGSTRGCFDYNPMSSQEFLQRMEYWRDILRNGTLMETGCILKPGLPASILSSTRGTRGNTAVEPHTGDNRLW